MNRSRTGRRSGGGRVHSSEGNAPAPSVALALVASRSKSAHANVLLLPIGQRDEIIERSHSTARVVHLGWATVVCPLRGSSSWETSTMRVPGQRLMSLACFVGYLCASAPAAVVVHADHCGTNCRADQSPPWQAGTPSPEGQPDPRDRDVSAVCECHIAAPERSASLALPSETPDSAGRALPHHFACHSKCVLCGADNIPWIAGCADSLARLDRLGWLGIESWLRPAQPLLEGLTRPPRF